MSRITTDLEANNLPGAQLPTGSHDAMVDDRVVPRFRVHTDRHDDCYTSNPGSHTPTRVRDSGEPNRVVPHRSPKRRGRSAMVSPAPSAEVHPGENSATENARAIDSPPPGHARSHPTPVKVENFSRLSSNHGDSIAGSTLIFAEDPRRIWGGR